MSVPDDEYRYDKSETIYKKNTDHFFAVWFFFPLPPGFGSFWEFPRGLASLHFILFGSFLTRLFRSVTNRIVISQTTKGVLIKSHKRQRMHARYRLQASWKTAERRGLGVAFAPLVLSIVKIPPAKVKWNSGLQQSSVLTVLLIFMWGRSEHSQELHQSWWFLIMHSAAHFNQRSCRTLRTLGFRQRRQAESRLGEMDRRVTPGVNRKWIIRSFYSMIQTIRGSLTSFNAV